LYESIKGYSRADRKITDSVEKRKKLISEMSGNDSVFTLYLSVDLDKSYFEKRSTGHFFYTPSRKGLSTAGDPPLAGTKNDLLAWLKMFFELTSYEISIPVLRESTLAPAGKTGLIISMLFDYGLTRIIHEQGWGDEFRQKCTQFIIRALDDSVYPGLADAIIDSFTSTPLTLQQVAGTTDGAITGWAFTNHPMPAENRLTRISKSVTTPIPNIFQAGQWTYSPAGFPVSLITGKIAADRIIRAIGKS
jgi:phytoene dehydrogenase-like protein